MADLKAAILRADITPAPGIRMCGYTVRAAVSDSVESPLTATALLLASGSERVFIAGLDILGVMEPLAGEIRNGIAQRLGVSRAHVLLNYSHTHNAATLPGWQPEPPDQAARQADYAVRLKESLLQLADRAEGRLEPARIAFGRGHTAANINRREKQPDGSICIGFNREGPRDESVSVLRVDALDGRPLGIVFSFGAHPVTMGPLTKCLSPDFVGVARRVIETEMECPSVFLQGGAGNILPITGIGGDAENSAEMRHVGRMVGAEALKVAAALHTEKTVKGRRFFQSVAAFRALEYEPVHGHAISGMGAKSRVLDLALERLPDLKTARATVEEKKAETARLRREGAGDGAVNVAARNELWANTVLRIVESGCREVRLPVEVGAARVGDVAFTTIPMEMFAETGLALKAQSRAPFTFPLGYTNGLYGYLPTPAAFPEGGMEVNVAYRNYNQPAPITPEWEPAISRAALDLVAELFP